MNFQECELTEALACTQKMISQAALTDSSKTLLVCIELLLHTLQQGQQREAEFDEAKQVAALKE